MQTTSSEIFTMYCSDFITSADNVDALFNFSIVAITAWNYADKDETGLVQAIDHAVTQIKRDTIENKGQKHPVDDLIREMIKRKNGEFSDHAFKVKKADFENEQNSIRINVEVL